MRLGTKLRARLPGRFEIVYRYESQDALVIASSPTEHGCDGLCSIGLNPDRAKLHLDASAKGSLIIQAEAQQQRARRATEAARPASRRRTPRARRR